jgi:hypothetical protein
MSRGLIFSGDSPSLTTISLTCFDKYKEYVRSRGSMPTVKPTENTNSKEPIGIDDFYEMYDMKCMKCVYISDSLFILFIKR